jgi:hypothetical protein
MTIHLREVGWLRRQASTIKTYSAVIPNEVQRNEEFRQKQKGVSLFKTLLFVIRN